MQFHVAWAFEMIAYFLQGMSVLINTKHSHFSWKISNGRLGYAHSFSHASEDGFITPACTSLNGEVGVEYLIPQCSHVNILLAVIDESAPNKNFLIISLPQTSDNGVTMDFFSRNLVLVVNLTRSYFAKTLNTTLLSLVFWKTCRAQISGGLLCCWRII